MLTENLRVLAGLQESTSQHNPLPEYITEIQQIQKEEEIRKENSTFTVASNFDLFRTKMTKFKAMFEMMDKLMNNENASTFVNGIMESKYSKLEEFAEITLNHSMAQAILFLENNFVSIEREIFKISSINEEIDEDKAETYFASTLISSKGHHGIRFNLFENKDLTEQVGTEIPYGTQIISIAEGLSMVKLDGKKIYSSLTRDELKQLEDKGLLL